MIYSVPFLAPDWTQLDMELIDRGCGVEASLFNRDDVMDDATWWLVRAHLERLSRMHLPSLTFHFPVNNSDYVDDTSVRQRLADALALAVDLGLDGVVLHSNRTSDVAHWASTDLAQERAKLADVVGGLIDRVQGSETWVGMENMPITGNDARELDPLLVYPEDLAVLAETGVGATWDVCHFSYTAHVGPRILGGLLDQPRSDYPSLRPLREDEESLLPASLQPFLKHIHFSAFAGVADATSGERCIEGVLPWESTVSEEIYRGALRRAQSSGVKAITLEIAEQDYRRRANVRRMLDWCRATLVAK